jgi:PAS domain S-box-containing protein
MSLPRMIGALFGALAVLLGFTILVGWAVHSTLITHVAPDLFPTQRGTAIGFIFGGLALLSVVWSRPRFTFIYSAITAILAVASVLETLFHAHFGINELAGTMSRATALCFVVLASTFVLAQISPLSRRPAILGAAGVLVGAVAAACCISVVWGGDNAFGIGSFTRMALPTAIGFVLLGTGAMAVALDMSQAGLRQPAWLSIGATVFVLTIRIGLLRVFLPEHQIGISSALSWMGALFGACVFGVIVHLALKAHLQRELLRRAEQATLAANEQLEQRVDERTRDLETANEDLRRQKEILQTIFDHLPLMVGFVDQQGHAQVVNREWERTLGWSLEEIRSQNIDVIERNYPDPEYRAKVRDFLANSDAEWADFKTRVRDGRVIDTSWTMLRLSDGTGIGIGQDITERKRADDELKESEERFRQLAESIDDLFWIKTPDFKRVLYLSPVYESLSGRPAEERYSDSDYQPFLDRILPEDRERVAEIMRRGARDPFEIDFRITRPDGSIRWIRDRGFPIRDQSGQVYRIAGIASDITERKLAEDALRESEERFRELTGNIREVFWITTADFGRQIYISPGFENLTGHPPETLYPGDGHKPFLHFIHPDDLPLLREVTNDPDQEFDIEYRVIHANGSVRWVRDRGFPIRNQSGQIYRFGGVAEDITARKEAEDRLKATTEQLRALSASLQSAREKEATRIARQIHDDLGGILTGLRWELESLEKMIHDPGDSWHKKVVMQNKLVAMIGLTDTTLNVVRRIASDLRPSILDDLGLVEAIEWQTQQFQARTGIRCCCECSLQTIGLPDQQATAVFRIVQEALTNILRHAQASQVGVAVREEDGALVLTVADNGRGITQSEIFSRDSLGMLGMRERAHLIGGSVDIVGVPGTGTTLHLRVPLTTMQPAIQSMTSPEPAGAV